MLPAYKGRVNRKTFILGNIVGLTILGFAGLIYIVPLAIMDIVINGSNASSVFKVLYGLFIIPVVFYLFYASVLLVKRMHDIGYPGLLILWSFIFLEAVSRLTDLWFINAALFLAVLGICALPGQKKVNSFGAKPGKKFKLDNLVVRF